MYILKIGRSFPEPNTGMMGTFEFEQALALNNSGNKVVYAFCDTRSIKRLRKYGYNYLDKSKVKVYGYHLPIGGIPQNLFDNIKTKYFKRLFKNILENEGIPDIIHIHFPLLTLTEDIWEILKEFNKPIVVTEHWSKVQLKSISSNQINFLRKIVDESNAFICVGDLLKKSVIELTNTNKNIEVIPNMVSSLFFYEERIHNYKEFTFVTVGRLIESKRIGLVINAFTQAFKNNQNVNLIIIGGGPLFNKYKNLIKSLGMNQRITMTGTLSRDEIANIMRKSDVFVSASVIETFGVPFIEAMACGKPVIGIKNGEINQYINDTNGILFEQDNVEELAKAMIRIYINRGQYDGKIISEKAIGLFSDEVIVSKLQDIYARCKKC